MTPADAQLLAWQYIGLEQLELRARERAPLGPREVRVAVAGCALAGRLRAPVRWQGRVAGGELSGTVNEAGAEAARLLGASVLIPTVLSCGECDWCRRGNDAICPSRRRLGVELDGGLATEVVVPAGSLCVLDAALYPGDTPLWQLAALVHGAALPYQALARLGVAPGQLVTIVGAGALGLLTAQLVRAKGGVALLVALPGPDAPGLVERAKQDGWAVVASTTSPGELVREVVEQERLLEVRQGPRFVLETTGDSSALPLAMALAAGGGAVALTRSDPDRATSLSAGLEPSIGGGDPTALPDFAGLVDAQITVIGVPYAHPELLTELAALAVRGELSLSPNGRPLVRALPLESPSAGLGAQGDASHPRTIDLVALDTAGGQAPMISIVVPSLATHPVDSTTS